MKKKMRIKVKDIKVGYVFFSAGSLELSISKRSNLLKKKNIKVGDWFELTLKKAK